MHIGYYMPKFLIGAYSGKCQLLFFATLHSLASWHSDCSVDKPPTYYLCLDLFSGSNTQLGTLMQHMICHCVLQCYANVIHYVTEDTLTAEWYKIQYFSVWLIPGFSLSRVCEIMSCMVTLSPEYQEIWKAVLTWVMFYHVLSWFVSIQKSILAQGGKSSYTSFDIFVINMIWTTEGPNWIFNLGGAVHWKLSEQDSGCFCWAVLFPITPHILFPLFYLLLVSLISN